MSYFDFLQIGDGITNRCDTITLCESSVSNQYLLRVDVSFLVVLDEKIS
ncbi:Uncharacterised protein [Legionella sainthelensi]|nr:Uncharacterised protein [Legionella sainthelensi]